MPIKPPRLHPGDTIAIVAPASAPPDPKAIDRSVAVLEKLGFKPKLAPNVRKRHGFLAGSDRERASDLMKMFSDPKVNAIFCVRGGYGTARLLPLLDYQLIRRHPKIFVGFSDITSLHCAFLRKSNLVSFHGPMLNSDLIKPDCPPFTVQTLFRTLMSPSAPGSLNNAYLNRNLNRGLHLNLDPDLGLNPSGLRPHGDHRADSKLKTKNLKLPSPLPLHPGRASGPLLGGNLSLLCTTIGTPWQPNFKNRILFLEDLDEPPYRFDRMLTHLLNTGHLQQVAGIAVGINANCEDPKAKDFKEYRQTLTDVLTERLRILKVPTVINLPFGHIPMNATLPIGIRATLDASKRDLSITESAVT